MDDQPDFVCIQEPFTAQRLRDRIETLESVCAKFFGRPMRLEIQSEEAEPDSDEDAAPRGREPLTGEAMRQLRQRALNHPAISRAVEILDGEITEIRPAEPLR